MHEFQLWHAHLFIYFPILYHALISAFPLPTILPREGQRLRAEGREGGGGGEGGGGVRQYHPSNIFHPLKWAFISPDRLDLISHMTLGGRKESEADYLWAISRSAGSWHGGTSLISPLYLHLSQADGRVALAALSSLSAHLVYCLFRWDQTGNWLIPSYIIIIFLFYSIYYSLRLPDCFDLHFLAWLLTPPPQVLFFICCKFAFY